MSIASMGDGSSRFGGFSLWGSRSRISWGAVLAGAAVAAATSLLLSLLGAAFGAGSFSDLQAAPGENPARAAGIWTIIALALSMALGGYVASRLSGTHSHLDGELHGITMWAVTVLLGALAFARLLGGAIEVVGSNLGPGMASAIGQNGLMTPAPNPQRMIERFEQSLSSNGDPTTMSREQIAAEIRSLAGENLLTTGSVSDADRGRLTSLVAAEYGVTKDEAAQRIARMESHAKARLARAEQSARAEADEIAQGSAAAARGLFTALVLGLLAALVGAWLGTRHKRVLHPEETQTRVAAADFGHAAYGVSEPVSMSVYDDAGHLVAQYLRGVSFPISKQDLLRFARSSGAEPALLHSIEGLADRSYVSANDVLGSMDMVH
jgi:Protein of unknown function (DUF2795)